MLQMSKASQLWTDILPSTRDDKRTMQRNNAILQISSAFASVKTNVLASMHEKHASREV